MDTLKTLTIVLLGLVTVVSTASAEQTPIDLSTWTPVTLDLGGQPLGDWVLLDQNTTARQTTNAAPTFLLNGIDQSDFEIHGTWRVGVTNDDDFVGFTFGHQDPTRCYIMDWKTNLQSHPTFGTAQEGFRILKIDAPSVSALTLRDFWDENDTDNKTVLASTYGQGIGWVAGVTYSFDLMFVAGALTVTVKQADTVLWETTVFDASFTTGQFGFYNLSQDDVYYSGFIQNDFPVCDAGGPYFGSAGIPVEFDASGSFDPDGTIVSYEWNFGDGSTGTGMNPTHTYERDGEFAVTLCVVDDGGVRQCCESPIPAVDVEISSFGAVKARF